VNEQDRIDYERQTTAYYEAGHVLAYAAAGKKKGLKVGQVVSKASIRPNRGTLGRVHPLWGWMSDYERADEMFKGVIQYQRAEKFGIPQFVHQVEPATHAARCEWKRKLRVKLDEIKPYAKKFNAAARRLVKKHRGYIEKVAALLLSNETINGTELPEL
jgi:ATP-dependent Zn protease